MPAHLVVTAPATGLVLANQSGLENLTVLVNKTHYKLIKLTATEAITLQLQLADYPGWKVYLLPESSKSSAQLLDHQTSDQGLIQFNLEAGEHTIELKLESTPLLAVCDLISAISFALGGVIIFYRAFLQSISQV
jgi:hypothetical protein